MEIEADAYSGILERLNLSCLQMALGRDFHGIQPLIPMESAVDIVRARATLADYR